MVLVRHKPKFHYNGLTIIMSNPSRVDNETLGTPNPKLITGTAGYIFENECLQPETNRYCCDIRLIDDSSELLPNTRCILLLGQRSLTLFSGSANTLDEQRGSPLVVKDIPCIASYLPQDTVDMRDYESRFNKSAVVEEDVNSDEADAGEVFENKGRGRTARVNYRFWLQADTKKALRICKHGIPSPSFEPTYEIYPTSNQIIEELTNTKGRTLYIDIETDFISLDMRCFAYNFDDSNKIFVIPTLDINYKPAYGNLHQILRALAIAFRDNTVVAHNGAVFDFFVFAYKYKIAIGRNVYDTLIAQHRIFSNIEKSLGHCISYWTYLPYHKDEGAHGYRTLAEAGKLWRYCGKDVYGMRLVKEAQDEFTKGDVGLQHSIKSANRSIRPYLISCLLGHRYDEVERAKWIKESDALMGHYLRIMRVLHGPKVEMLISNKKCTRYFHDQLKYSIVKRTPTGGASLAADALLKLRLKHDNPVIDFLIKFREKQKEIGTLNFKPWICNT